MKNLTDCTDKFVAEKYLADMKEAKQSISEKSSALFAENFKYNRLQVSQKLSCMDITGECM